jgi:DNA polymerase I-like protein with 3'-5' exonuclease and polymerase domains
MNLLNKTLILDIETDGLDPTKIWCCATNLFGTVYDAETFNTKLAELDVQRIVAHNGIGFDYPVMSKLWGVDWSGYELMDSLVLSRLANPSREAGHSLRQWGARLGFPKGDHEDWSQLSPEMVKYCEQDVAVTVRVLECLQDELVGFSEESVKLEHDVQRIIQQQIKNGWLIDAKHTNDLLALLKEKKYELEETVQRTFMPLPVFVKEVTPKVKKDGTLSAVGLKFLGDQSENVAGWFSRIDYPPFNLGSRQQIGRYLQWFGWKPKTFTEKGQPIVDESVLETVTDIPEAKLIAEYLMIQKRVAQVQSWLDAVQDDGRVHGYVNTNGAVTGRMTHSSPNMAQVPAVYSPYGHECRSCWSAPEGYSIVGCDASGLELRMLAHYMKDEDYTNEIINGDIHTANQRLAGLESRNQAKTFIYALLYGAGDEKLGTVVGRGREAGKQLRESFLNNLPSFADLKGRVSEAAGRGYLIGLDGRKLGVRSEHSALNTLLQSAGSLVMKKALTLLDDYGKIWGIDYKFVGNIHDEIQAEVINERTDTFGRLAVSCIQAAGLEWELNCPLDGEYKVGKTWAQTH